MVAGAVVVVRGGTVPAILILLATALGASAAEEPGREEAVRLARQGLAQQLGVSPDSLAVRDVRPTRWNDSSLGCPVKGRRYMPVLTPGYEVELEHEGRSHVMHVGAGRAVSCDRGSANPAGERAAAPLVVRLQAEARRDLARRLDVPEQEVTVKEVRPTTWPDASLGCPGPDQLYAQVLTEGYVIELEVGGARYRYHADQQRAVYCPRAPQS